MSNSRPRKTSSIPRVTRPRNMSSTTRPRHASLLDKEDSTPDLSIRRIVQERSRAASAEIAAAEQGALQAGSGGNNLTDDEIKREELRRRSELASSANTNSKPPIAAACLSGEYNDNDTNGVADSKPPAVASKPAAAANTTSSSISQLDAAEQANYQELSLRRTGAYAANIEIAAAENDIIKTANATGSTRATARANEQIAANFVIEDYDEKSSSSLNLLRIAARRSQMNPSDAAASATASLPDNSNSAYSSQVEYDSSGLPLKHSLPPGARRPGAYTATPGAGYDRVHSARYHHFGNSQTLEDEENGGGAVPNNVSSIAVDPTDTAPSALQEATEHETEHSDRPENLVLPVRGSNDQTSNTNLVMKHKTIVMVGGVIVVLVAILAIVISVVVVMRGGKDEKPSVGTDESMGTPALVDIDFALLSTLGSSTVGAMSNSTSPQYQAYAWLANDPQFLEYEKWQKLQRFVLATFFFAFNGPNWMLSDPQAQHWLSYDMNECDWIAYEPKACTEDGRVRFLNITRLSGFKGSIPPELSFFDQLEGLDFSRNIMSSLEEVFSLDKPSWIPPSMQILRCSDCLLGGTIPPSISSFSNLLRLDLKENELTSSLPTEICKLAQLRQGFFASNQLSGGMPSELGMLSELEILQMNANRFTGIPTDLGRLSQLTTLDLGANPLQIQIPSELGQLTNLQRLKLEQSELSGSLPTELGRLTALVAIFLGRAGLTGTIPSELGSLTKLQEFLAFSNSISGSIPSTVGLMTSLRQLDISLNELSSTIPSEVGLLSQLSSLRLNGNSLSGSVPTELSELSSLTDTKFNDNPSLVV